jgi:hypothetical protein
MLLCGIATAPNSVVAEPSLGKLLLSEAALEQVERRNGSSHRQTESLPDLAETKSYVVPASGVCTQAMTTWFRNSSACRARRFLSARPANGGYRSRSRYKALPRPVSGIPQPARYGTMPSARSTMASHRKRFSRFESISAMPHRSTLLQESTSPEI